MTEQRVSPAREALCIAIGLSQAQFASASGGGLDSGALIAAIDTYTEVVTADARADISRLRDALIEQEWAAYSADGDPMCGWCGAQPFDDEDEPGIHDDGCFFEKPVIRAALAGAPSSACVRDSV